MSQLIWSATFVRATKRLLHRHPELQAKLAAALRLLAQDPFHPALHSHKLKGDLAGVWACTVDYDMRILFEFVQAPESGDQDVLLLTVGTHDEVY